MGPLWSEKNTDANLSFFFYLFMELCISQQEFHPQRFSGVEASPLWKCLPHKVLGQVDHLHPGRELVLYAAKDGSLTLAYEHDWLTWVDSNTLCLMTTMDRGRMALQASWHALAAWDVFCYSSFPRHCAATPSYVHTALDQNNPSCPCPPGNFFVPRWRSIGMSLSLARTTKYTHLHPEQPFLYLR